MLFHLPSPFLSTELVAALSTPPPEAALGLRALHYLEIPQGVMSSVANSSLGPSFWSPQLLGVIYSLELPVEFGRGKISPLTRQSSSASSSALFCLPHFCMGCDSQ